MTRLKTYLLLALVATLALSSCEKPSEEWREQTLRVMSYNVHNCSGTDGVRDYARVAGVISKYDPDLVAIQEVDSMTSRQKRDVTAQLAARTGYYGYFAPAIPHTGGKYGVAILSKKPVLSIRQYELPCSSEIRTLAVAEYKDYYFICTHFSLHEEYRLKAVEIAREVVAGLDKPVLLAGDLNAYPDSKPLKKFEEFMVVLNDTSKPTFSATNPTKCIDYVLGAGAHFVVKKSFSGIGCQASDHLPIYVDVEIKKQ